jgi:hypothetical protein
MPRPIQQAAHGTIEVTKTHTASVGSHPVWQSLGKLPPIITSNTTTHKHTKAYQERCRHKRALTTRTCKEAAAIASCHRNNAYRQPQLHHATETMRNEKETCVGDICATPCSAEMKQHEWPTRESATLVRKPCTFIRRLVRTCRTFIDQP